MDDRPSLQDYSLIAYLLKDNTILMAYLLKDNTILMAYLLKDNTILMAGQVVV
jgi:hypothetical protein